MTPEEETVNRIRAALACLNQAIAEASTFDIMVSIEERARLHSTAGHSWTEYKTIITKRL